MSRSALCFAGLVFHFKLDENDFKFGRDCCADVPSTCRADIPSQNVFRCETIPAGTTKSGSHSSPRVNGSSSKACASQPPLPIDESSIELSADDSSFCFSDWPHTRLDFCLVSDGFEIGGSSTSRSTAGSSTS
eukprot:CAMPEP_0205907988 /NCGR_PEP_ID=MMETSP1325-20131115/2912_1 /ASSEMBLY_ACC=CAM_ASM_000708 /TAXON_ID=236786 /ORGANISM="Florenciella sp., Strain RCC1007" /LENGTH=132 /DNA_ID=CAMNT_0053274147 /DNA_START=3 /DNA_END=401 /DNA_ORIENTATION=-